MKKIVSAPKTMPRFSEFAKMSFFSCISITRWVYYGRIVDKFNNSCAIAIFCSKSKYNKNGAIFEKRGVDDGCHILLLAYHKLQAWEVSANSRLGNNYCGTTLTSFLLLSVK